MNPMSVCSSSSSTGSSSNAKSWIVHGIVAGVAIAVAVGAHAYLGRSGKFRSRVVGIIPARFASSRFQGKPLVHILGKPMIQAPENDIGKNSFNYFQIRSAFSMVFSTLTNPKTIMALGPNRSILGTIIRPDPILLERKGGSNGDVTFNSLLPGAGEPLQHQYEEQQGILCNWQLGDEEEPLPRGNSTARENTHSSGKKRKASSKEKSTKKVKEMGSDMKKMAQGKRRR